MSIYKVILLGDYGVGKTTALNQYLGYEFENYVDFRKLTLNGNEFQFWDTGSQERFRSIPKSYYRDAEFVYLFFDLKNPTTYAHLDFWLEEIEKYAPNPYIILIGSKSEGHRQIIPDLRK